MRSQQLICTGWCSKHHPPDEVFDAMRSVGISLPEAIRETGKGGLAATTTGQKIAQGLQHE